MRNNENVTVSFRNGDSTPADNATLLLAAAEELGLGGAVVRTTQDGFSAPQEVVDKAFGKAKAKAMTEPPAAKSEPAPAKKAAAKKAPAKKAPAKKTAKKG